MAEQKTIEFWIAINEDGEWHIDQDCASDARDGVGGEAIRVVAINVKIDIPTVETINVAVEVPALSQAPAEVTVS